MWSCRESNSCSLCFVKLWFHCTFLFGPSFSQGALSNFSCLFTATPKMPLVPVLIYRNTNQRGKGWSKVQEKELFYLLKMWKKSLAHTLTCIVSSTLVFCLHDRYKERETFGLQRLIPTPDIYCGCSGSLAPLYLLEIPWWDTTSVCLCLRKVEQQGPQTPKYQWHISGSAQSQNTVNIHRRCEVIKLNIQHGRDIQSVS